MASALYLKIQEDMKNAMRAKETERLGTIRLLLAAIKQKEIDERIVLDEPQILSVIDKMIKQRRDSITQYQQGNRQDLVNKEAAEIEILKQYLPQSLTDEEINNLIKDTIAELKVTQIKDMAKVMAYIKPKAQGRADLGKISAIVKSMLQ